jgi:hypothetical protein
LFPGRGLASAMVAEVNLYVNKLSSVKSQQ